VTVRVAVRGEPLQAAQTAALTALRDADVPRRLAEHDAELWGPEAEHEASIRLGWLDVAAVSRELLPDLLALRDALRAEGVDQVVLCGMGGSSLAPEVICREAGVPLTVLDSTHPDQVRAALDADLARTVVVVSSKSGGTLETDSQRRSFVQAFTAAGIDPAQRVVVVTDPGSPLEQLAREEGYRAVFLADPNVGGRYSALTAFGLVPSALAGADVEALLAQAEPVLATLDDDAAPGLVLDDDSLDHPVRSGISPTARRFFLDVLEWLMPRPAVAPSVGERVMAALGDELGGDARSIEEVAHELAMSTRSLRRQLAAEGTSYLRLVDAMRRDQAVRLMDDACQLKAVAHAVGFSDPRGFRRAFKRWTGLTPRQFRDRRRARPGPGWQAAACDIARPVSTLARPPRSVTMTE
jgi:AraC-like DNA-binding protein